MTIEMPAGEVYALAAALGDQAEIVGEAGMRLIDRGTIAGPLTGPVESFLSAHRLGCRALGGELSRLATTLQGVADSWLVLDGGLLPPDRAGGNR